MTTTLFMVLIIIGSTILFLGCALSLTNMVNSDVVCMLLSFAITFIFDIGFCLFAPSMNQMIENDYYAMLDDRPTCIDANHVSLGCKEEYIDWQRDSIDAQHKYDSVKVVLDNKQKELLK